MEPNEKAEFFPIGFSGILSWGGLAIIGTILFVCGANEWSLIPVFVGAWILWRGGNSTGLAIFIGIGLSIFLTRFGVSLERGFGFGTGWESPSGSIILAYEDPNPLPVVFAALGICLGYWFFCSGIQMESTGKITSNRVVGNIPFFALEKWVAWFWVFILVAAGGFGVYEILLRQPDELLSSIGWRGSMRLARFLVLAWLLGAGVILVQFWVRLPFGRPRSKSKSLGYLQDILWRETRREQSRSEQWIVRAVQSRRKVR